MQLQEVTRFGIPERLVTVWREQQGDRLLPVQRQVIRKGLLGHNAHEQGRSFVICAPTSSGKSFCAELAAAAALARRQKVIMLFPLKALAEEKYRRLKTVFGGLGLSCLIATADHPENDALLLRGRFDLAVAIYEKLDLLLAARLDLLTNVGLVVVDELQMIAEPGRGVVLERLLTRLRASHFSPQVLGLSAVVGDESGRQLADWLGGELIEEATRPVELLRGVAANGSLRYRSFNSGCDGTEPFTMAGEEDGDLADLLLRRLKQDDGPTLVFLKSRHDTVRCAVRLAAQVNHPPATTCLEQLRDEEPSFLVRSLRQVLSRGVAFHNADLSMRQRDIIEQGFINKEISTIISTTTLAMGINLPADTVYL
ncbi:MAG: DEAD/DEAH box helicase, partial [Candidatus Zixiibacteriota bacterium]